MVMKKCTQANYPANNPLKIFRIFLSTYVNNEESNDLAETNDKFAAP